MKFTGNSLPWVLGLAGAGLAGYGTYGFLGGGSIANNQGTLVKTAVATTTNYVLIGTGGALLVVALLMSGIGQK